MIKNFSYLQLSIDRLCLIDQDMLRIASQLIVLNIKDRMELTSKMIDAAR